VLAAGVLLIRLAPALYVRLYRAARAVPLRSGPAAVLAGADRA
jgi:hypothetical protein